MTEIMDFRERISRWALAIGLWGCALWMAAYGYRTLEFTWFLPAIICGVIGICRVFNDILALAAKPFTSMIDAIIFPKVQGDKPPPNYRLADYYVAQERWDDAEMEYRTILGNHRKEKQAYLALIRLLIEMDEKEEAEKVFKKARRHLRNQSADLSEVEMEWHQLKR